MSEPDPLQPEPPPPPPSMAAGVAVVLLTLGVSAFGLWLAAYVEELERTDPGIKLRLLTSPWALPALFGFNVVSCLVPFMAVSGLGVTGLVGTMNPGWELSLLVAVIAGTGQAMGELGFYAAGYGSRGLVAGSPRYQKAVASLSGHLVGAMWFLFVMALIPNPVFKVVGSAAGAMRFGVGRFLAAVVPARVIKNIIVVFTGAAVLELFNGLRLWLAGE